MSTVQLYPTYRAINFLLESIFPDEIWKIGLLGNGAVSVAWEAHSETQSLVVRAMPADSHKPMRYAEELAISQILFDAGCPVPEPIACSVGHFAREIPEIAFDWAVTRRIEGKPILNKALTRNNAHQMGKLLAHLHGIPAQGYGQLQIEDSRAVGQQKTALDGAKEHWQDYDVWGIHEHVRLESTVIGNKFPEYLAQIKAYEARIRIALSHGAPVVCHTDLHSEHIFLNEDAFAGVIDFGDACLLPPAWDFAIAARYFGWRAVDDMLERYTKSPKKRVTILDQAYALGLVVGVFKLQRQFVRNANVVIRARTLQFIIHTLNRLSQR